MTARKQEAQRLQKEWTENPRWKGIRRGYGAEDVVRLRGSVTVEYTLARRGAQRLWQMLTNEPFVNASLPAGFFRALAGINKFLSAKTCFPFTNTHTSRTHPIEV